MVREVAMFFSDGRGIGGSLEIVRRVLGSGFMLLLDLELSLVALLLGPRWMLGGESLLGLAAWGMACLEVPLETRNLWGWFAVLSRHEVFGLDFGVSTIGCDGGAWSLATVGLLEGWAILGLV